MGSDSLVRSLLTSGLVHKLFSKQVVIMSKLTALNVCAIDILPITSYLRIDFVIIFETTKHSVRWNNFILKLEYPSLFCSSEFHVNSN